jgi:hypothetical protein
MHCREGNATKWPPCSVAIPLGVWACVRYREALANRTRFLEKMREPQMQQIIRELLGQRWRFNANSLTRMVKRITRGDVWLPGKVHGVASHLNAEEILMLKDRTRTMEALPSGHFADVARQIHEEGLRRSARWLRALHHLTQADKVSVEAGEGEARTRTRVTRMVERCPLVLRAGGGFGGRPREMGEGNRHPRMVPARRTDDPGRAGGAATKRRRGRGRDPGKGEGCLSTGLPPLPSEGREASSLHRVPRVQLLRRRTRSVRRDSGVSQRTGSVRQDPSGRVYITQSRSGWVSYKEFKEWAIWVCL